MVILTFHNLLRNESEVKFDFEDNISLGRFIALRLSLIAFRLLLLLGILLY